MGAFITFEGIEGCGKTTQVRLAADYLRGKSIDVVVTEEPGGSRLGAELRRILLNRGTAELSPRAELLLFLADRAQHVEELIRPALEQGKTVLCDRYCDATIAYQGFGRGLGLPEISALDSFSRQGLAPDMTLLFDLPPETGLERAFSRIAGGKQSGTDFRNAEDRFEHEGLEFHSRVREGYLSLARREPNRFRVLDASLDVEAIAAQVRANLGRFFRFGET